MKTPNCSYHSKDRLKERAGLNNKAADRMVEKVYKEGLTVNNTTGTLNTYLVYLEKVNKEKANQDITARVYGRYVYIFNKKTKTLITIYQIDHKYEDLVDKQRGKKKTVDKKLYRELDEEY